MVYWWFLLSELHSGLSELHSGLSELHSGLSELHSGLSELHYSGLSELHSGLSELHSQIKDNTINDLPNTDKNRKEYRRVDKKEKRARSLSEKK